MITSIKSSGGREAGRERGREGGREGERAQINSQSIGYGQVVNFYIIFTSTGY